jgi:hypothetical protein
MPLFDALTGFPRAAAGRRVSDRLAHGRGGSRRSEVSCAEKRRGDLASSAPGFRRICSSAFAPRNFVPPGVRMGSDRSQAEAFRVDSLTVEALPSIAALAGAVTSSSLTTPAFASRVERHGEAWNAHHRSGRGFAGKAGA